MSALSDERDLPEVEEPSGSGRGGAAVVLVEHDADGALDASLRAVTFARSVGPGPGPGPGPGRDRLTALVVGSPPVGIGSELGSYGVGRVLVAELPYAPLAWARALSEVAAGAGADIVAAAGTDRGNEVMAHLGALAGDPMAANCLALERQERGWRLTRSRWGGSLLEEADLASRRALVTIATDAVSPQPAPASEAGPVEAEGFVPRLADGDGDVVAIASQERGGGVSLANARVVVSGGRGLGGPEGFFVIEELARELGGAVGVSRAVTSLGWRPHREQVGQTGTKVTPELYLACGISGAVQHLAGCQSAKTMVAVNTDEDAPIMSRADYAVVGDVAEVLPALLEAIRARSAR